MATAIINGTFEEAGHIYKDAKGMEVPSATQILESCGLVNFDDVPGKTLEHKRQIGDAVHYATRLIDRDGDVDWDTVHEECVPYVLAWENFKSECCFVPDPEWIEKSMVHTVNGMPFGMTIDRLGRIAGIKYRMVLEIKCAYNEEKAWRVQTAFYEMPIPKDDKEVIGRMAVQLKPDGKYKPYFYENPRDKDIARYCLALTHFKINEGLKWKKESL